MYKYIASKLYIYDYILKIRGYIKKINNKTYKGFEEKSSNSQNMFVSFIFIFLYRVTFHLIMLKRFII